MNSILSLRRVTVISSSALAQTWDSLTPAQKKKLLKGKALVSKIESPEYDAKGKKAILLLKGITSPLVSAIFWDYSKQVQGKNGPYRIDFFQATPTTSSRCD